jgi:hypothetical protein
MPLAEVQAKWIAQLISGKRQLPTSEQMKADIQKDIERMRKRYKASPRHTLQVDFHTYKESIERELR